MSVRLETATPTDTQSTGVLRWLVAATFVAILNETITLTAMPRLMAHFGVDESAAQWLATVFLLTMAVVIPITGWFLQQVTTRQAFLLAMSVFTAGTLLAALAPVFWVLIVARIVQAAGTAVMMPLLMTTLMKVVPESDRGRVMGNVTMAIAVAPALGPAVSGLVLQSLSWRWIFLIVLPVAVAVMVGGLRRLTNVGEPQPAHVDWLSVALAADGFGALVYGLSEFGVVENPLIPAVTLGVGIVGVTLFVLRQLRLQRDERPLLDLRTLRIPVYRTAMSAMALAFLGMLGSMVLLQLYLQNLRGMTPLEAGLLVMPGGLAMGLLGPRVGRWYDRVGGRVLVLPGAAVISASFGVLALVDATTPIWVVLAVHIALMLGLSLLFTPLFTMGLGSLPAHLYSHGSSLLGTVQQVAGAFGTALVVMVMSSRAASLVESGVEPAQASLSGMHWAFAVSAVVGVLVLALVSRLPRKVRTLEEEPAAQSVDATG
ncbi:MDR family MFS transporter [Nocardioides rotundus]|uniref:MDR family MFS transporter n=1 Tax=Nocardioides rotundus TaxID=1774216 RepID=UPI001CBE8649|nr:MDR family MFS transporter [Nocardioides rotundus]